MFLVESKGGLDAKRCLLENVPVPKGKFIKIEVVEIFKRRYEPLWKKVEKKGQQPTGHEMVGTFLSHYLKMRVTGGLEDK